MRAAALVLACALPTIAHADDRCQVTYVSVPDGIDQVIDNWVSSEPNCHGSISLRVIPTKDGLFLFAERPDGTVHERLVPDLTAAGVLVASWVTDSWRRERPRKKKRAKKREVRVIDDSESLGVTSANPVQGPPGEKDQRRWLSFGLTRVPRSGGADLGFRVESDMILYRGFKLSVVAQKVQDSLLIRMNERTVRGNVNDWSAGVVLSKTLRWRRWELRGGAGISLLGSKLQYADFYSSSEPDYTYEIEQSTAYELSASLGRDIGDRWGLAFTFAATFIAQDWISNDNMNWYEKTTVPRHQTQPVWTLSLRRSI